MNRLIAILLIAATLFSSSAVSVAADSLYCRECGKEIAGDSKFCQYCGTSVIAENDNDEESNLFQEANAFFENGDYKEALGIYRQIKNTAEAKSMINECYYHMALEKIEAGDYDTAISYLDMIDHPDQKIKDLKKETKEKKKNQNNETESSIAYDSAMALISIENYTDAYEILASLSGYKDVDLYLLNYRSERRLKAEKYIYQDNLGNKSTAEYNYKYNDDGSVSQTYSDGYELPHYAREILSLGYDPYSRSNASSESFYYDSEGKLVQIIGKAGYTEAYQFNYFYDENNRISYEEFIMPYDSGKTYYTYNENGTLANVRLDRESIPSVYYYYLSDGRLDHIATNVTGYIYTIKYVYDDNSILQQRKVTLNWSDYLTENYEYNADGTVSKVIYEYANKNNGQKVIEYEYDDFYYWKGSALSSEYTASADSDVEGDIISDVEIAFDTMLNLSEKDLTRTSLGNYRYNGITLQPKDYSIINDKMYINSSCMYNSVAFNLSAWCDGDGAFYGMTSNDFIQMVTGQEKKEWDLFKPSAMKLYEFIKQDATEDVILKAFESLDCCSGTFDYSKRTYSFHISDLELAANELGVSQTMLGYILAYLEMYPSEITFSGNALDFYLEVQTYVVK